jgi:metal-responsive CopG/Arc/MetJ family transcriptional regulator
MKTAISIPDKIFKSADNIANRLGISRSELYTKAIEEYIKELNAEQITNKLNEIYSDDQNAEDFSVIKKMQIKSLKLDKEKW